MLPTQECNDVISSVDSLFGNVKDILAQNSVTKSLPDFIDGETKEFELYWDDNTEVILEEDEDLFVTSKMPFYKDLSILKTSHYLMHMLLIEV